jgi:hypothetical protein
LVFGLWVDYRIWDADPASALRCTFSMAECFTEAGMLPFCAVLIQLLALIP